MRGTRGILHNIGWLTVGQVLSQLLGLAALVYLARHLGTHWFGVVQIGVTLMGYAIIVAEWGMYPVGIRTVSRLDDPTGVRRYASVHTGLMAIQALIVVGLGLLVLPRLSFYREDPVVFVLYLVSVIPQALLLGWVAVGLERGSWVGAVRTGRALIYALLVLLAWKPLQAVTGMPAQRLVPILYLVALIGGILVIGIPVVRWIGGVPWPRLPRWSDATDRWRQATPIATSVVVVRALQTIDIVMIGLLATAEVAGNYAAAARIVAQFVIGIELLWVGLLPRFSRLARVDRPSFERSFNLYLGLVLTALLPLAVGGALVGDELMAAIYGAQFPGAGPVFRVLSVSMVLLCTAMFLGNTLISEDRQARYLPAVAGGAAIAIVATAVLIPRLGGLGASLGMAAGHAFAFVVLAAIFARRIDARLGRLLLFLVFALVVMGAGVWAMGSAPVFVRIGAGALLYAAVGLGPVRSFTVSMRRDLARAGAPGSQG